MSLEDDVSSLVDSSVEADVEKIVDESTPGFMKQLGGTLLQAPLDTLSSLIRSPASPMMLDPIADVEDVTSRSTWENRLKSAKYLEKKESEQAGHRPIGEQLGIKSLAEDVVSFISDSPGTIEHSDYAIFREEAKKRSELILEEKGVNPSLLSPAPSLWPVTPSSVAEDKTVLAGNVDEAYWQKREAIDKKLQSVFDTSKKIADVVEVMGPEWAKEASDVSQAQEHNVAAQAILDFAQNTPNFAVSVVGKAADKRLRGLGTLGTYGILSNIEAGGFMRESEQLGVPDTFAMDYAKAYGYGAGALEYAGEILNVNAVFGGDEVSRGLLKKVKRLLLDSVGEGLTEVSQQSLQYYYESEMLKDYAKQNNVKLDIPEQLPFNEDGSVNWSKAKDDLFRSFQAGAGVSLVSHGIGGVRQKFADRSTIKKLKTDDDFLSEWALQNAESVDKLIKTETTPSRRAFSEAGLPAGSQKDRSEIVSRLRDFVDESEMYAKEESVPVEESDTKVELEDKPVETKEDVKEEIPAEDAKVAVEEVEIKKEEENVPPVEESQPPAEEKKKTPKVLVWDDVQEELGLLPTKDRVSLQNTKGLTGSDAGTMNVLNYEHVRNSSALLDAREEGDTEGEAKALSRLKEIEDDMLLLSGKDAMHNKNAPKREVIGHAVEEVSIDDISMSKDVAQFKAGADPKTGVVQPLGGQYERKGTAPIVLWKRKGGKLEVITGRHRLDLARRSGEKTIPAQVLREIDGFTKEMASSFDAESNIRDGQGTVGDFATYFRRSKINKETAQKRGLLSRKAGQEGFEIGSGASNDLFALYKANKISSGKAAAISKAAPNNKEMQALGISFAATHDEVDVTHYMNAMKAFDADKSAQQLDLFGNNDAWKVEAEKMASVAADKTRVLNAELQALKTARSLSGQKRKAYLEKYGVAAGDQESIEKRITEIEGLLDKWDKWHTDAGLVQQLKDEIKNGEKPVEAKPEEQKTVEVKPEPKPETKPETKAEEQKPPTPAKQEPEWEFTNKIKSTQDADGTMPRSVWKQLETYAEPNEFHGRIKVDRDDEGDAYYEAWSGSNRQTIAYRRLYRKKNKTKTVEQQPVEPKKEEMKASVENLANMSNEDFEKMLDEAQKEVDAKKNIPATPEKPTTQPKVEKPKAEQKPKIPRVKKEKAAAPVQKPDVAVPAAALASAAKYGVQGIADVAKGLHELFGASKRLGMGLTFDEDTYAKAKPYFKSGLEQFIAANKSMKEFFMWVIENFGPSVKQYLMRFKDDLNAPKIGKKDARKERSETVTSFDYGSVSNVEWDSYEVAVNPALPAKQISLKAADVDGNVASVEIDAKTAFDDTKKRFQTLRALLNCVKGK